MLKFKRLTTLHYAIVLLISSGVLLLWPGLLKNFFSTQGYDPHGSCFLWQSDLVGLFVITDTLIGLSYVAISCMLAYFVYRTRHDIPFHWVFLAFGGFIIACGNTHFMDVLTVWIPVYWFSGYFRLITALASVATALALPPVLPKVFTLIRNAKLSDLHRKQLEAANAKLEREIQERKRFQKALEDAHEALEIKVDERTAELQQSERRYRFLADTVPQLVWTTRPDGWLNYCNQRWSDYTGQTLKQMNGRLWGTVLHPDDEERGLNVWKRAIATGQPFYMEARLRRGSDGGYRWYLARALPMRDGNGRIIEWVGTCTDIDDQKQAQEALRINEARFRTALQNSPITVSNQDRELHYTWMYNPLFGLDAEQIIGRRDVDLLEQRKDGEMLEAIKGHVLATGKGARHEICVHVGDAEYFGDLTVEPLYNAQQELVGVTCATMDITERIQVERERQQLLVREQAARLQAEEALRTRDDFLAVAAHELKTPVTSLRGFAQVLMRTVEKQGTVDPRRLQQSLQAIETQSVKLTTLIARLLEISRFEAGRLTLERETVDVTEFVKNVVLTAQKNTTRHTLLLESSVRGRVSIDPLRIEQVLINLLDNAIKFSPDGGPINVQISLLDTEWLRLMVADRGMGIPPERRAHLFDRFYQAHGEGYRGGMGLGLYISRQIVELHGGRIEAEFPDEGGTRFVVSLPRAV